MRIWNIAKTDVEINDYMYVELSGAEEGLVAYYPFDEGSGQVAHDMTMFANDGRLGLSLEEDDADPTWVEIADRPTEAPVFFGQPESQLASDGNDLLEAVPETFELQQNYPNPFNAGTTITFNVPANDAGSTTVTLAIYDVQGRMIRTLAHGEYDTGSHTFQWNGMTDEGNMAASGIYFYRMIAGDFVESKRMVMLK